MQCVNVESMPTCYTVAKEDAVDITCSVVYSGNLDPDIQCIPGSDDDVEINRSPYHRLTYKKTIRYKTITDVTYINCTATANGTTSFVGVWSSQVSTEGLMLTR